MKILIDNSGYELKNSGDVSMLVVAVRRIYTLFDEPEISVITVNNKKLAELFPDVTPIGIVGRHQWNSEWNLFGGFHRLLPSVLKPSLKKIEDKLKFNFYEQSKKRILSRMHAKAQITEDIQFYLSEIESADYVIATGGGFMTDAFAEHAYRIMTTLMLAQSLGKKTAMFGQGLGPITNQKTINIAKKVFPELNIIGLREGVYSPILARMFGAPVSNIQVTGDDAIEMAFSSLPQKPGQSIGVNLRIASYSAVNKNLLIKIKNVLTRVAENYQTELVPIPISGHDEDSDFKTISILLGKSIDETHFRSSEQVIQHVSLCRVVVTGSYHAAVYALSQGISVAVLIGSEYYQHKFTGLAEQFKSGCILVNTSHKDFDITLEKSIKLMWDASPTNRDALILQAKAQIGLSDACYRQFFKSTDSDK